jgi:hypothetical protein
MKVNDETAQQCLFNTIDAELILRGSMNVLGVIFESKLNWSEKVETAVMKANKSLNARKLISRFFSSTELQRLATSNFIIFCTTIQRFVTCLVLKITLNNC